MQVLINDKVLEIVQGDITEAPVEAIVNAANVALKLGSGVAGAIRIKGGPSIQEECDHIGGTHVGGAVITGAGALPIDYVIHAVGPQKGEADGDDKLRNATLSSLRLCDSKSITTVAFPAISTGVFGFPIERCAEIMLSTVINYLQGTTCLKHVLFCLFDAHGYAVFEDELTQQVPSEES